MFRLLSRTSRYFSQSFRPETAMASKLTDIGTRSIFTEEHDMFREQARRFFTEEVLPHHEKWENDGQVSRECWEKAGEIGLLGVMMPEKYGGAGADILYSSIVWDEQAYVGCSGPGFGVHNDIVLPYLLHYGTEDQKERLLPNLIRGKAIGAIAMTEPCAGSDLQGIKTTAKLNPDGSLTLNGSKTFITNGAMADYLIVVARTDASKKAAHGTSLLIVETGMQGFTRGRKLKKMGLKAQDTSELFFDNVHIPKENILGELNKGFYYLMNELPQERLMIGGSGIASAEACFEWTRNYVKERKAFGTPLAEKQIIRHKLAELKTDLTVGRAFTDQCLVLFQQKRLTNSMASMLKYWCTDLQSKVADQCVQLHGGYGFMWEYPVCRAFVDARVQSIYGGTNEIMKELIARDL